MAKFDLNVVVTEKVTDNMERILSEMESRKGNAIDWRKPWRDMLADKAINRFSKRTYNGINQLMLNGGEYGTYKQWAEIGGKPKKGCAQMVVFWTFLEKEVTDDDGNTQKRKIPYFKYYNVWACEDVLDSDGKPFTRKFTKEDRNATVVNPIQTADEVAKSYIGRKGITFETSMQGRAYFRPLGDYVHVPSMDMFVDTSEYYSTLFHELTHSTGTKERLARDLTGNFGTKSYSREELVAELGACGMLATLGIETNGSFNNSIEYIRSWIKVLKENPKWITWASSRAEKAVEYIIGDTDITSDVSEESKSEVA